MDGARDRMRIEVRHECDVVRADPAFNAAINAVMLVFAWPRASVAVGAVACTPMLSDAVSGLTLTLPSPFTVIDLTSEPASGAGSGEATEVFGSSRPTQLAAPTASIPTTAPPTIAPIHVNSSDSGSLLPGSG